MAAASKEARKNLNVKCLNIFPFYHNVLIFNENEVLSSVPVEAQAARKDKTIGARRNLNFALADISSSIIWKDQAILC